MQQVSAVAPQIPTSPAVVDDLPFTSQGAEEFTDLFGDSSPSVEPKRADGSESQQNEEDLDSQEEIAQPPVEKPFVPTARATERLLQDLKLLHTVPKLPKVGEQALSSPSNSTQSNEKLTSDTHISEKSTSEKSSEKLPSESTSDRAPPCSTHGFLVTPVDDNIYKWHVKLFGWDQQTQIYTDMFLYESATGRDHVLLEVSFPGTYPDDPPFFRVVYPRFHQYTGHITIGGSICVKELTKTGWRSDFEILSFIIMIRNLLLEGYALVDMDNAHNDYTEAEAKEAFHRVAQQHGWKSS